MMTCAECLTAVAVADYTDMAAASPIGIHCASCRDCARVVTEVRDRERNAASMLGAVSMSALPAVVTRDALFASRRRVARRWRRFLIAALGATASFAIVREVIPRLRSEGIIASDPVVTMTLQLKCITSSQASDLATPYLRTRSPAIYQAKDLGAVTLRGASIEVEQARRAIEEFDVKCQLPLAPGTPAPDIPPR